MVVPDGILPELSAPPAELTLSVDPKDWFVFPDSHRSPAARTLAIAQITGHGGVEDDAFARHLTPALRAWSEATGLEACLNFCRRPDNSRYSGIVSTSRSQIGCQLANVCPSGYVQTPSTIHTHPPGHITTPNASDRRRMPIWMVLTSPVVVAMPEWLSPADKKLGMGCVVTQKRLLKFNGQHSLQVVDETLPPVSVLPPGTKTAPVLSEPPPEIEATIVPFEADR